MIDDVKGLQVVPSLDMHAGFVDAGEAHDHVAER
jgi:hypothetical protein